MMMREYSMLKELYQFPQLQTPRPFELIEVVDEKMMVILMQSCGPDLLHTLYWSDDKINLYAYKILSLLAVWHDMGYVHRDIKPMNICCCYSSKVYFVDVESAVRLGEGEMARGMVGTEMFAAPEVLRDEEYNHKAGNIYISDLP